MWKCMRNIKVSFQDESEEEMRVQQIKTLQEGMMKRKKKMTTTRLRTLDDDRGARESEDNSTSGTRRIRLLVTKEELIRILSYYKNDDDAQHASLAQLLSDVMLREKGRTLSNIEEHHDGGMNSWRPALESIPEDGSMK